MNRLFGAMSLLAAGSLFVAGCGEAETPFEIETDETMPAPELYSTPTDEAPEADDFAPWPEADEDEEAPVELRPETLPMDVPDVITDPETEEIEPAEAYEALEDAVDAAQESAEAAEEGVAEEIEDATETVEDAEETLEETKREGEKVMEDAEEAVEDALEDMDEFLDHWQDADEE